VIPADIVLKFWPFNIF